VTEALVAQGPHDPLGDGVRLRGTEGRQQRLDTNVLGMGGEVAAVHAIAIPDEVLWLATPGRRLDELPPHPGRRGMRRHRHVDQFPAAMRDEVEHVQRAERERLHSQEIGRPDRVRVVP
jgi:hypothetical protein